MERDHIKLTIETHDGKVIVKRVKGLVFIAQDAEKKGHTLAASIGRGSDLIDTLKMIDRAVNDVRKGFFKEAMGKMPSSTKDDLNDLLSKLVADKSRD